MDNEAPVRHQLMEWRAEDFFVEEDISLETPERTCRADVLATPKSGLFTKSAPAFELKVPNGLNFPKWTHVFRQAADYVDAPVSSGAQIGKIVNSAFVFPSPPYDPYSNGIEENEYWRKEHSTQLAGALHMAAMLNAGMARMVTGKPGAGLNLNFGPNGLWRQGKGWLPRALENLSCRRFGSRTIKLEL